MLVSNGYRRKKQKSTSTDLKAEGEQSPIYDEVIINEIGREITFKTNVAYGDIKN